MVENGCERSVHCIKGLNAEYALNRLQFKETTFFLNSTPQELSFTAFESFQQISGSGGSTFSIAEGN